MDNSNCAIIFDFDGTLADTLDFRIESWTDVLSSNGISVLGDLLKELLAQGLDNRQILDLLAPSTLETKHIARILKAKDTWRREHWKEIKLFPEAKDVLRQLRDSQVRLAVFSRNRSDVIRNVLREDGCIDLFDHIEGRSDHSGEPEPDFLRLIRLLGRLGGQGGSRERIYFVGDTPVDRDAARDARVRFIGMCRQESATRCPFDKPIRSLWGILNIIHGDGYLAGTPSLSGHATRVQRDTDFTSVRKEILQTQRLRVQVLAFTVAAVAVLIGLPYRYTTEAKTTMIWLVCSLAPWAVLIPSAYLVSRLSRQVTMLGAYLLVFQEHLSNRQGYQLHKYWRDVEVEGMRSSTRLNYAVFYSLMSVLALGYSLVTSWELLTSGSVDLMGSWQWWTMASLNVVALGVLIYILCYPLLPNAGKRLQYKAQLITDWNRVRNKLESFGSDAFSKTFDDAAQRTIISKKRRAPSE